MRPLEEFAREKGFTVHSFCGDRKSVFYVDDSGVFFNVHENDEKKHECTLEAIHKLVQLKVGPFSMPNSNFDSFYKQIRNAKIILDY